MQTQGKITHWNQQKAYGFITPSSGDKDVFVHIHAFKNRHLLPELNQVVLYSLSTDKQGRPCAVKVMRASEIPSGISKPITRLFLILFAIGFLALVGWSTPAYNMPIQILYLYLAASAFTFLVYAKDKWAAQSGRWRTKESSLHALALIGGWPGALIAQQMLRHKSGKDAFQFVFWATVVVNCAAFAWFFTTEGRALLQSLVTAVG